MIEDDVNDPRRNGSPILYSYDAAHESGVKLATQSGCDTCRAIISIAARLKDLSCCTTPCLVMVNRRPSLLEDQFNQRASDLIGRC